MKDEIVELLDKEKVDFEKSRLEAIKILGKLKNNPQGDPHCDLINMTSNMLLNIIRIEFLKDNFYLGGLDGKNI